MEVLDISATEKYGSGSTTGCLHPQGDLRAPHHGESHAAETQLRRGVDIDLEVAVL